MSKADDRERERRARQVVEEVRSTFELYGLLANDTTAVTRGLALADAAQHVERHLSCKESEEDTDDLSS